MIVPPHNLKQKANRNSRYEHASLFPKNSEDGQKDRKVKTGIDTFYCLRCRAERGAAERMADCSIVGGRAILTALCETCETVVVETIAYARIPDIAKVLDLSIRGRETTLKG